jgi:NhaA family Na+:H+ antiporter
VLTIPLNARVGSRKPDDVMKTPSTSRASGPAASPIFEAVVRPVQAFFRLEAASGLVLLAAAAAALAWANLGGAESYRAVVETPFRLAAGPFSATFTLHALVNDGLMTLFFFVVGMEIKRELVLGELRTPAQAALPLVAAAGGMVVPAAVYLALNASGPGRPGWGIPMATDIAFAIGVLTLLRSRVPHALVVFVTALAIFDDIGGILVIAIFYGTGLSLPWLAAVGALSAAAFLLGRAGQRHGFVWALLGGALWWALHEAGIHATIGGVLVGLAIPARATVPPRAVIDALATHANALAARKDPSLDGDEILAIEDALEDRQAPLGRFETLLHPWVAFGVMPVFALVNSGVEVVGLGAERVASAVAVGTALALFAGKLVGVFAATAAAVKLGLAPLPGGASWGKLAGVSLVTGIGFTVALFIAGLAFPADPALLDEAKIGILAGSLVAGVAGALVLRATPAIR